MYLTVKASQCLLPKDLRPTWPCTSLYIPVIPCTSLYFHVLPCTAQQCTALSAEVEVTHKRLLLVSCSVSVVVIQSSPAHHVNKPSPAVQHVWFGWYCGLGRFPYGWKGCLKGNYSLLFVSFMFPLNKSKTNS